jgi:hypothetical protein
LGFGAVAKRTVYNLGSKTPPKLKPLPVLQNQFPKFGHDGYMSISEGNAEVAKASADQKKIQMVFNDSIPLFCKVSSWLKLS